MPTGVYKRKPFSEEHKRHLKESNNSGRFYSGFKHSEKTKRKIGLNGFHYGMLGKHHTEEWKIQHSKKLKGKRWSEKSKEKISGKKHWNWKGGLLGYKHKF